MKMVERKTMVYPVVKNSKMPGRKSRPKLEKIPTVIMQKSMKMTSTKNLMIGKTYGLKRGKIGSA